VPHVLVRHEHVGHLAILEQSVVNVQHSAAGVAENKLDTLVFQSTGDHLATG